MDLAAPSKVPAPTGRLILLVDDEPDICQTFQEFIQDTVPGTTVFTAESGASGLALLAESPVDLIISDFHMPVMDGIGFLAECRRLYPSTPRVMFTQFASEELANRAVREAFVDSFLTKAADPSDLIVTVTKLLSGLSLVPNGPSGGRIAPASSNSRGIKPNWSGRAGI